MWHLPKVYSQMWRQALPTLLAGLALILLAPSAAFAQFIGGDLAGNCPQACNVKVSITKAELRDGANGIDAVIEWSLDSFAPELKLTGFSVAALVEFKRNAKDNTTVQVGKTARKATVHLTQSGKNKDIKFSDVTSLTVQIMPLFEVPASVPVNVTSRSIKGEGNDSAVEVQWSSPPPLPCSASAFFVTVSARNEKNDELTGSTTAVLTQRSAKAELKGAVNKKGLHDPAATVTARSDGLVCQTEKSFTPKLEGFTASGGSNTPNPAVTIKTITVEESSGRTDTRINWDVVEPSGFTARGFNLTFAVEELDGRITPLNTTRSPSGNERSTSGPQLETGKHRNLFVTITATFANSNNTTVLTREDKKTRGLVIRATPPQAELSPPTTPKLDLAITTIKAVNNGIETAWQVKAPVGVTITSFDIEAQVGTSKNKITVAGPERQAALKLNLTGTLTPKAQVKVTANGRQANGATFQQSVTREETLIVPPVNAPVPTGIQVNLTNVQIFFETNIRVRSDWQIQVPTGFTVLTNEVEYTVFGTTRSSTKKVTIAGTLRQHEMLFGFSELGNEGVKRAQATVRTLVQRPDLTNVLQTATREQVVPPPPPVPLTVTQVQSEKAGGNFIVRTAWQIQVPTGVTLESFQVEATLLKPTGPVKKSIALAPNITQQNFTFTSTEANGTTGIELKVTANLRRPESGPFQVIATGTSN